MSEEIKTSEFIATGEATAILPARNSSMKPITVIGTEVIRNGFDVGWYLVVRGVITAREISVLGRNAHFPLWFKELLAAKTK